jgi:hypothetical protein
MWYFVEGGQTRMPDETPMFKYELKSELVQKMFYDSEGQIITKDIIRRAVRTYLFDRFTPQNDDEDMILTWMGASVVTNMDEKALRKLHTQIKQARGKDRIRLAEQQIDLIAEALGKMRYKQRGSFGTELVCSMIVEKPRMS